MKKILLGISLLLINIVSVSALTCVDLKSNLKKGNESNNVLELQNFLADKGFLTAKPNGYFGQGTFSAVKKYQKSVGLSQSGQVFPLTRATIKNETCTTSTNNQTSSTQSSNVQNLQGLPVGCTSSVGFSTVTGVPCRASVVATSTQSISTTTPVVVAPKVPLTNNQRRQNDVVSLITAMYAFYLDSNGTFPIPYVSTTSIEICAFGISLCDGYNEVRSSLVPNFLSNIPSDPSITNLASTTGTGYFITRLDDGTITVTAPKADGLANIFAKCNFFDKCKIATTLVTILGVPHIDSFNNSTFFSGGISGKQFVINGNNFSTSSNTVVLSSKNTGRKYTLGNFTSADSLTINASSSFTNTSLSCGSYCSEIPPIGDYNVKVITEKGESNDGYISIKGITTQSVSNGDNSSFIPKSTHVKLATITISSSVPVDIKKLNIYASSSPINIRNLIVTSTSNYSTVSTTTLPALYTKISNYTITDVLTDTIINGGPLFALTNQKSLDNQSKIYELYANIADIENVQAGQVTFTGDFVVEDYISRDSVTIPIPKFVISVSY